MNTMQALAIAALKGDMTGALALADLLMEEHRNSSNMEEVEARRSAWSNDSTCVQGIELYAMPEFRALCRLLGIMWELPTTDMAIFIPVDGLVTIEHNYQCRRRTGI
jgi:hypothetical protein